MSISCISLWFDIGCRLTVSEEYELSLRGMCYSERISKGCLMSVQLSVKSILPYCVRTEFSKLDHSRVFSVEFII